MQMLDYQRGVARCFIKVGLLQKRDDLIEDDRTTARQMCTRFRALILERKYQQDIMPAVQEQELRNCT
jgi:hypothetical protein